MYTKPAIGFLFYLLEVYGFNERSSWDKASFVSAYFTYRVGLNRRAKEGCYNWTTHKNNYAVSKGLVDDL